MTLVYLHGGGGLHPEPWLDLLPDVRALELPGFGDEPERDSFEAYAEFVLDATRDLDTFTLAGTSFGSVVALHVVFAAPERVDALALLSPAAFHPPGWVRPEPAEIGKLLFANPNVSRPEPASPDVLARRAALLDRLLGGLDEDALRARLETVETPTLVVCGTEDRFVPPEMGREYRAAMPNCSFVLLYGAAHELGWDCPEALAALVADFARRRETFAVAQ